MSRMQWFVLGLWVGACITAGACSMVTGLDEFELESTSASSGSAGGNFSVSSNDSGGSMATSTGGEGGVPAGGAGGQGGQSPAACGDGLIGSGEQCDDANVANNDGCSETCTIEGGWSCTQGEPSVCGHQAFSISPDDTLIAYLTATNSPPAPATGNSPIQYASPPPATNDACSALQPDSLIGSVALIQRGSCTFYQKAMNAQDAGAVGVIVYNNLAGSEALLMTLTGDPPITIPVIGISNDNGLLIYGRLGSGSVTMTWTTEIVPP